MAKQRLRPGTWTLVNSAGASQKYQIDYQVFVIRGSSSNTFEVKKMAVYDDTSLSAFNEPPQPLTVTSNVGGEMVELTQKAPVKRLIPYYGKK